ncbi:DNA-directed RNA polymerase, beta subunit [Limnospira maxima CS-328]|uniref:DNA-directed RNA polymerase subunit beta n=2 Tax=Limnospira maxima TaxID=129910 RepID=B5W833_LIMMA|nr:DNA-directed RNA polymerase, beta subunit [Limnospira maxima CS-328]
MVHLFGFDSNIHFLIFLNQLVYRPFLWLKNTVVSLFIMFGKIVLFLVLFSIVVWLIGFLFNKVRKVLDPPRLKKLKLNVEQSKLYGGERVPLSAQGYDQYGNSIAVDNIEWSSSSGRIVKNQFEAGEQSETVVITAKSGSITDTTSLRVTERPRLVKVAIAKPKSTEIDSGESYTFEAYGLDQYGDRYKLEQLRWSIKVNPHLGLINQDGHFQANSTSFGQCTIQAQVDQFVATQEIVIPRRLTEIKILPAHSQLQPEEYEYFRVEGYDQSGLNFELSDVSWSCDRGGKINQQGIFRAGYDARFVKVEATFGELTDAIQVELLPVLRRLELKPSYVTLAPGANKQFEVIGRDQFGERIDPGYLVWNAEVGTITQSGFYQADPSAQGKYSVEVASTTAPKWTRTPRHIFLSISIISKIASFLLKVGDGDINLLLGNQDTEKMLMPVDQDAQGETSDLAKTEQIIRDYESFFYKQLARLFSTVGRFCEGEANAKVNSKAVVVIEINPPIDPDKDKDKKFELPDFSEIQRSRFELPDLIEIQRSSFRWFLETGLIEELESFSPISDYTGKLELHFLARYYKLKQPKYDVDDAKRRDSTYSVQMYVPTRLINKETGEIKEQEVFIGDLPLMTERGTFIINGAERVIVNQIVRSPGVYYKSEIDKNQRRTYSASLIPNRGAWLKFETDKNDLVWVRIDKTRKLSAQILLKALGLTNNEIFDALRHPDYFQKTIEKEGEFSEEDALMELYRKLRPGEPPTITGGEQLLQNRFFDPKRYDLGRVGRHKLNRKLRLSVPDSTRVLTPTDILSAIDYLINLEYDIGETDDIDHLGNRRVRSVGELLQNQIRVGLNRLERIIRERMTVGDAETLTPASLVNPKPLVAAIKEFFGSSQLSQFMDQTNPLAELTHKRRLSALGPGGLTRERAGFAVRDIHPSHYGRICPIETPEGPNAGLIGSLATHARVNPYGFIETPYYPVENGRVRRDLSPVYMTADEEDDLRVAPGDISYDSEGYILGDLVPVRYRQDFTKTSPDQVDYVAVSPVQIVSVATSLIPFLEHDDANRALMGSNMQRQAVPLLRPERPFVGTGLEAQAARDSGMVIVSRTDGEVSYVDGAKIRVIDPEGWEIEYELQKYQRSNQDTCLNQRPLVYEGDQVVAGQVLADGSSTEGAELALGHNVLVAYMPWEGYNYEDAILISERLVYDDVYTSIHIEKFEIEARQTKLGPEEITREIPNVGEDSLRQLDASGIIRIGAWVESGDILVGKVTPKGESDQPPEEKLLRAIFGEKARDVRDNSLRVPNGEKGRVVDVRVFTREQGDELPPGANMVVRVYVAQKRKIQVGDKMAGRHGNKGIVSRILPIEDMPYLPDGRPMDIVLNPLGVPSRMNVGQIFECLMGWAGENLKRRFKVIPFDEMFGQEMSRETVHSKLKEAREKLKKDWLFSEEYPGKTIVYDGRTGEAFDQPVTVGIAYILKLVHLVDDKIHARSTGPYSLVTQQPLGGKAQQGGQRFGEMEVWALEAFGAAYTLQELLTVKSDDMAGRNEALNAIVKGKAIPRPGTPESFKVLMRELQSLCLDIAVHKVETNKKDGASKDVEVDLMADEPHRVRPPSKPTYDLSVIDDDDQGNRL